MKRIISIPILLAAIVILLASCSKHSIRGNGSTTIQSRALNGFTAVKVNSDIKVYISYGATQKVEVKGYENLVAITETNVQNNILNVKYNDKYYNVRNSNIEVYISIPSLTGVATNGSGNVAINQFQNAGSLDVQINGSSNFNITNCIYNNVQFDINGSGDIRASGLSSRNAEAIIHGSGDIEISCSENLKARIYGSGDIRYWGNPLLDVLISGSGTVRRQ